MHPHSMGDTRSVLEGALPKKFVDSSMIVIVYLPFGSQVSDR